MTEPDREVFCEYCRKGFIPGIDAGVRVKVSASDTITGYGVFSASTYCNKACALVDAEATVDVLMKRLYPVEPALPRIILEPFPPEANRPPED